MIPVDEILESLDLSRAQPGIGFLEALFVRFNARVPFENVSKILRDRKIADPAAKPRNPEVFWTEHLELGTGGTCFARVAAFDALLSALGFSTRRLLGRVERDFDHAGLAVAAASGETLADVGFPLPALIPPDAESLETPLAELRIEPTPRGKSVAWVDGVPEGPRALELFSETATPERFEAHWRATFRSDSRFLARVAMRRSLDNRIVSYAEGALRVDDRHSRLSIPVPRPAASSRLSELFGIERELIERALDSVGGEESPTGGEGATLTAYLEVEPEPSAAIAAIASAAGYRRLVEGVAEVFAQEPTSSGFRLTMGAPGQAADSAAAIRDEVSPDPAAARVRLERWTGKTLARSSYAAERRGDKTYLLRVASLGASREDLLRNDSLRGRLAGILALDLLAWSRML